MKKLLTLSTLSLIIASVSAAYTTNSHNTSVKKHVVPFPDPPCSIENQCLPGSTFTAEDNCNTCTCPDSGLKSDAICNESLCCNICTPGTFFDKDYMFCECPPSGLMSETTYCAVPDALRFVQEEATCVPGDNFQQADDETTYCTCPSSGLQKDGFDCYVVDRLPPLSDAKCIPGTLFELAQRRFTFCTCTSSGYQQDGIDCLIVDPLPPISDDMCISDTTFISDDNYTCFCPDTGLKSETTVCYDDQYPPVNTPCVTHQHKKKKSSHHCKPGSSFPASDGCNTCYCPDNGIKKEAGCTEMLCITS